MLRRMFILAGAALTVAGGRPAMAAVIGRVVTLVGSAVVVRGGGVEPLAEGTAVLAEDIIRTGPGARVRIELFAGISMVVGPSTEIRIAHYLADGRSGLDAAVRLVAGIVRLIGAAVTGPTSVAVETPQAIAAVRGTDWLVEITPAGTAVFVVSGLVAVRGRAGGEVELGAGEGTDVPQGGEPMPARVWGAARRDAALAKVAI